MNSPPHTLHPFNAHLLSTPITRRNYEGQLALERSATEFADPTKPKEPSHDLAILGEALVWPLFIGERNCALPAIAFAAGTFGVPYLYPQAKLGGVLIASYGLSAGVYLLEFFSSPPLSQLKGSAPWAPWTPAWFYSAS